MRSAALLLLFLAAQALAMPAFQAGGPFMMHAGGPIMPAGDQGFNFMGPRPGGMPFSVLGSHVGFLPIFFPVGGAVGGDVLRMMMSGHEGMVLRNRPPKDGDRPSG